MHTEVFRILIIDDHPIVALGIKTIASKHENAECVVIHDPSLLTQVLFCYIWSDGGRASGKLVVGRRGRTAVLTAGLGNRTKEIED